MLSTGDQCIFSGHIYWVGMVLTLANNQTAYLLRQAHWPKGHYLLVNHADVVQDVPFTA